MVPELVSRAVDKGGVGTQRELAKALGVRDVTISQLKKDKVYVGIGLVKQLADMAEYDEAEWYDLAVAWYFWRLSKSISGRIHAATLREMEKTGPAAARRWMRKLVDEELAGAEPRDDEPAK